VTAAEKNLSRSHYIGRFAPSPSGKLHFGSLVGALASYLDARSHNGEWLVRMEDLDPPREEVGAADSIIKSLDAHHLFWDQSILYQSQRIGAYQSALEQLGTNYCGIYRCNCSRQRIIGLAGPYDGHCEHSQPPLTATCAIRLKTDQLPTVKQSQAEQFEDLFLGQQQFPLSAIGDMIIRRKDGFFAYQLAVAVDDHYQNISHIVRGHDLIDSTSRQRYILLMLNQIRNTVKTIPEYGHTPLALGEDGDKLSKQTKAPPIDDNKAAANLIAALQFLNHSPPLEDLEKRDCKTLLKWAIQAWQRSRVPTHSAVAPSLTDA
jgi:glutamyl-Q tRNA(Asp) synthetase